MIEEQESAQYTYEDDNCHERSTAQWLIFRLFSAQSSVLSILGSSVSAIVHRFIIDCENLRKRAHVILSSHSNLLMINSGSLYLPLVAQRYTMPSNAILSSTALLVLTDQFIVSLLPYYLINLVNHFYGVSPRTRRFCKISKSASVAHERL